MTLVLSYIDANVTVHVADRRLTRKVGGKYQVDKENSIKVALVGGSVLVSYAGRSEVNGIPTLRWIETRLTQAADGELKQLLPKLAARLTGIFCREKYLDQIVIATLSGWALDEKNKLIPFLGGLTNQDPTTLKRLPAFHGVAATAAETHSEGGKATWAATGRLSQQGQTEISKRLRELAYGADPADIANVFIDQIRVKADRDRDSTIGKSLRAAILPLDFLNSVQPSGNSNYVMPCSADGDYILGQAMVVDLPEDRRMEAHYV